MRLPFIYVVASGLAATLLFAVQPWAAKVLLPWFGGSASVWLTSLLFFQVAVVVGYLYAHVASRAPRFIHVAWCLAAAVFVPIAVAPHHLGLPAVAEVLIALAAGVGVAVVFASATTPLLHSWLARTADDDEPYALYAASNAGSLLGLLAYPLVVEPFVGLNAQSTLWRGLFLAVALTVAVSAWVGRADRTSSPLAPPAEPSPRGKWFINAFVPASLLYGFTAFLTRDIAAFPLIWVLPLGIYLVTFVLTFKRRPLRAPEWFAWAGPAVLYVAAIVTVAWPASIVTLVCHVFAFAVFALYFHGELSRARPPSSEATAFYLWVSFGGVAAGIANAVIAPLVFSAPLEYPLTYGLALILIPAGYASKFAPATRTALHATMMVTLAIVFAFAPGEWGAKAGAALLMLFSFVVALRLPALSHAMLALFLGAVVTYPGDAHIIEQRRSFYGSHTVEERTIGGVDYVGLADGITLHGHERVAGEVVPLGYYNTDGPGGEVLRDAASTHPTMRVALIGLGVGSLSLYSREGDVYQFFELDPTVVDLARTRFRSLSAAVGDVRVDVVDGRLGLQGSNDHFDVIVVDAFSSDAVPTHLLTLEAFQLYGERLADGGRVLLHTSNRFLDIDRVAIGALDQLGWAHRYRHWDLGSETPAGAWPSSWIVAAPQAHSLGAQATSSDWQILRSDLVWTDSYSSVLGAIR